MKLLHVGEMPTVVQVACRAWGTGVRNTVPVIRGRWPHRREVGGRHLVSHAVYVRASGTAGWGTPLEGRCQQENETTEGFIRVGWCPTVGRLGSMVWRGPNLRWPERPAFTELGACLKVPPVLKHPGGGGRSQARRQPWCLPGQPWDGPPAPTAWPGLRVLPIFSWFASGGSSL